MSDTERCFDNANNLDNTRIAKIAVMLSAAKQAIDAPADNDYSALLYNQLIALAQQYSAKRLVLFGSRARGDNKPTSDIDLAVYEMPKEQQGSFYLIAEELPTLLKLDIIHINKNTSPALLKNIEKDGVLLYEQG